MSDIATGYVSDSGDPIGSFETETPEGPATVEVIGTPTNCARVDVKVDNGHHWVFGVNDDTAVLVMVLNEIGSSINADLPRWIEPIIRQTGLEGVEKA